MMQRKAFLAALAVGTLATASPAHTQGVIPDVIASTIANMNRNGGGPSVPCMRGEAPAAAQIDEARAQAQTVMQTYLARAGTAAPADASAAFTRRQADRAWMSGGAKAAETAVDDPLARAVAAGSGHAAPAAFIRSGDGRSAQGVWLVTSADGASRLGRYEIMFRSESGGLRIIQLALVEGSGEPAAIRQYCRSPGDVEVYLAQKNEPDRPDEPASAATTDSGSTTSGGSTPPAPHLR
jgi:hypothetical protein